MTHHQPTPTLPLATETPVPPKSTLQDTTGPPMPPISPIDTGSPSRFTHAEFESSHTPPPLTTTHPWPRPIAPPRQLYPPLAFKHPTLSSCLPAQDIHNHLLPPLPWYMFHKPRIHMTVTLSRGNMTKLSNHRMQTLMLHPNKNRLAPSNQGDAAQVPT